MDREAFQEILNKAGRLIDKSRDEEVNNIVMPLCNLVEDLYSENVILRDENRRLKDENNRLKGEQGKPHIKGRSKQNISTDKNRRNAEKSTEKKTLNNYGYKLDNVRIEKLMNEGIPEELVNKLKLFGKNSFRTEEEFLKKVKSIIGEDNVKKYKDLLVKVCFYKKRNRGKKVANINIDRTETCFIDETILPEDAYFLGYTDKVVQDILVISDNIKFRKEVYYSPSMHRTFTAKVPYGYEGGFGPGIKTQIINMKYVSNMSEPKILETLRSYGVMISSSYISEFLTKSNAMQIFHKEKEMLYRTALECGKYQQIDDTTCRVNGENKYVQIVCNPLFTAYFTTERKDRLTVIDVLRDFSPRFYMFNNETFELLEKMNVSPKTIDKVKRITGIDRIFDNEQMNSLLNQFFLSGKGKITKTRIKEAAAIAFYHQEHEVPIVKILICDDAPQFKLITENLGLCWVHDARHYKKLTPIIPFHKKELDMFMERYWDYYRKLCLFRKKPNKNIARILTLAFDDLFSTKTKYEQLNERIRKTKLKKDELLTVLKFPEIPLHNNISENAARVQKRRQDVSLQTKTQEGTKAKDTMMSIIETCKKLGINSMEFIHDRISKTFDLPSLANIIKQKSLCK